MVRKKVTDKTYFAGLLGLVLIWSWLFWLPLGAGPEWLTDRGAAVCYPFFNSCRSLDPFSIMGFPAWNDVIGLCGLGALIAAALGRLPIAQTLVTIGFLVKLMLFLLDFRLMGNYHLIGFYFAALFLVAPGVSALQFLFTFVYFFAGLLKLNPEWIGGHALYGEIPGLTGQALVSATTFVVVLELLGSFLLLSRTAWVRWTTWSFFVSFHLISMFVVGFFYPAVMLSLLLFFPYCWNAGLIFQIRALRRPATIGFFAVILAFQLIPASLPFPALTGEGRFLALNMFDAKARCSITILEREGERIRRELDNPFQTVGFRIGCDPYLFYNHLKHLCARSPEKTYSLHMQIRGSSDSQYPVQVNEINMCNPELTYTWWRRNSWIKVQPDLKVHKSRANQPRPQPLVFQDKPLRVTGVNLYRKNNARTGHSGESLRSPVRIFKRIAPLNRNIHGASKGSAVADASGLYLGTDTGRMIKVSWQGDILWEYKVAADKGIHGSPVVTDHDVFIGAYNGNLYRLDKETGQPIWIVNVGETIGSSPLWVNGSLFVTIEWNERPNGGLVRVDPQSGEVVWQSPLLGEQIHSSASYDEINNLIVFGSNHGTLFAYTPSGEPKWLMHAGDAIKSTPAILDGMIYVTSWDGFLYKVDGQNGQKVWKAALASSSQSSPTLIPELGQIVVGDDNGLIRSFQLRTGELEWSTAFDGQITGSATVFRSGSAWRIATGCRTRTLCLLSERGKVIQEIETRSEISGEPGVFGGKIFAVSDRHGLWIWE